MSYTVVIPSSSLYNLSVCVPSFRKTELNTPIVVIEDGPLSGPEPIPFGHYILGEQPFIFSRNINQGIVAAGGRDIILLNDDAVLVHGNLSGLMHAANKIQGIVSASIRGAANNPAQLERTPPYSHFPRENYVREIQTGYLAFVCVAIPRSIIHRIGMLDERFTTYGGEDVDYCHRARVNGIPLAIYDGCVMDHGNILKSTFRRFSVPDIQPGLQILREKWAKIQNTSLPI